MSKEPQYEIGDTVYRIFYQPKLMRLNIVEFTILDLSIQDNDIYYEVSTISDNPNDIHSYIYHELEIFNTKHAILEILQDEIWRLQDGDKSE